MPKEPASIALDEDAGHAYHRLRHEARLLGTISHAFDASAGRVTRAYFEALTQPWSPAWSTLVAECASLVRLAHAFDGIVAFGAAEQAAIGFFATIVSENADLLTIPGPGPVPADR